MYRNLVFVLLIVMALIPYAGRYFVSYENATLYLEPDICSLFQEAEPAVDGLCILKGTVRHPIHGADYEITLQDGTILSLHADSVRMLSYPIEADDNE